jgi:hypothetical protein
VDRRQPARPYPASIRISVGSSITAGSPEYVITDDDLFEQYGVSTIW